MKMLLLPALLFCMLFAGCDKKESTVPDNYQKLQAHPWKVNRFYYLKEGQNWVVSAATKPCIGQIVWSFSATDMERKGYEVCGQTESTDPDPDDANANFTKPYSLICDQTQIRTFDNAGRKDIYDILTLTTDTLLLNSTNQRGPLDPVFHLEFIRQ